MEWFQVTLLLYRKVFSRGAALAKQNWPVLLTVFAYSAIMRIGLLVAFRLGILGGFLISFLYAACVSSFLYLVEMIVRTNRVSLEDFRNSFSAYLWDVIGVMFVFWIVFFFLTPMLMHTPQGPLLVLCLQIAIFVFFNAVPELIYLGHFTVMQLLGESYSFIAENWLEWFPANLLIGAMFFGILSIPLGGYAALAIYALLALFAYFSMVVRGLLFLELHGSTRRGRAFRYRVG